MSDERMTTMTPITREYLDKVQDYAHGAWTDLAIAESSLDLITALRLVLDLRDDPMVQEIPWLVEEIDAALTGAKVEDDTPSDTTP